VQVETFEPPQLAIPSQVGVLRPPQKRVEIHEANRAIAENQAQLIAREVFGFTDIQ
jgi:hypothetical protein